MKLSMKLTRSNAGNFTEAVRRQVVFEKLVGFSGKIPSVQNSPGNPHGGPPGHDPGHGGGGNPPPFSSAGNWSAITANSQSRLEVANGASGLSTNDHLLTNGQNNLSNVWYKQSDYWNGSAWSSETATATNRSMCAGGGVSRLATWIANGISGGGPVFNTTSETYDGSVWTAGGIPSIQQNCAGAGPTTAAISCGDHRASTVTGSAQIYNGSAWSGISSMPASRARGACFGAGSTNATFAGGDSVGGGDANNNAYEWSGSAWATLTSMNIAREYPVGCGDAENGIVVGGFNAVSTYFTSTERYTGTWSTYKTMITARCRHGLSGGPLGAIASVGQTTGNGSTANAEKLQ